MRLGTSCSRLRHRFYVQPAVLEAHGGWNFFLLTEDIEFTIASILRGFRVGYCRDAVVSTSSR